MAGARDHSKDATHGATKRQLIDGIHQDLDMKLCEIDRCQSDKRFEVMAGAAGVGGNSGKLSTAEGTLGSFGSLMSVSSSAPSLR